uniref:Secreted protein n=1 Tax=Piliocolobus tephrosceles TaxID=591936 RepID=A0A8C9IQZ0_9PRIM
MFLLLFSSSLSYFPVFLQLVVFQKCQHNCCSSNHWAVPKVKLLYMYQTTWYSGNVFHYQLSFSLLNF